jgi:hypothetical protein
MFDQQKHVPSPTGTQDRLKIFDLERQIVALAWFS